MQVMRAGDNTKDFVLFAYHLHIICGGVRIPCDFLPHILTNPSENIQDCDKCIVLAFLKKKTFRTLYVDGVVVALMFLDVHFR